MKKIVFAAMIVFMAGSTLQARERLNGHRNSSAPSGGNEVLGSCESSKAKTDLDINNVRTKIFINGDMWWDLAGTATYEIPQNSGKHSLFAGAVWVGGLDSLSGQLRVAAQTYRQSGSDFWPGPISVDSSGTHVESDVCIKYDQHFKITLDEVKAFYANYITPVSSYVIPDVIKNWPGNGDLSRHQAQYLAPFFDRGGDGFYDYLDGDYPYYTNLDPGNPEDKCDDVLLGDQTLWWVFNDVGNIHKETNSAAPIGLEIQSQAFAFKTNDEINNMTFYKYKIINRNTTTILSQCYFGAWVDPDLGNYIDDYVGCDVKRGFGYCYNGDENDDGSAGYGINPPAVGLDFFQGPKADLHDGLDNDRDSCFDCTFVLDSALQVDTIVDSLLREEIIMSKFVYYDNDGSFYGNPDLADDYYGYLKGFWRNAVHIHYGGNGHDGGNGFTTDDCDFMFPGDTDPYGWGTPTTGIHPYWDEVVAGNQSNDRRFLQSAGPFTLMPGAVNYITTGAVWARATNGGRLASVRLVRQADDYAQALFSNCFKIVNGPDAPDVAIRELNNEILMSLTNGELSNNNKEIYSEKDPNTTPVSYYFFEGYQIFQLRDQTVTITDIHDPDKARLIAQCDIKNGVSQIINFYFQPGLQAWSPLEEVAGADGGLRHTFRITNDAFASGDATLINHKTYYYTVLAYAYNVDESAPDPNIPTGRNLPYKAGRRNIYTYTAIPHAPEVENNGMILNTSYGDGPELTRIEGTGNGYVPGSDRLTIDMKAESVNEIFSAPFKSVHPTYERARGPVDVRIYDPVDVKAGTYLLWATDTTDSARWVLKNLITGHVDSSDKTIESPYDQIFVDQDTKTGYGFYVNMTQVLQSGDDPLGGAGYIEATASYNTPTKRWLGGVPDIDGSVLDWIASGKDAKDYSYTSTDKDGQQVWEKLLGGTWAPYKFTSRDTLYNGPAYGQSQGTSLNREFNWSSVDIVFTSDKSKWSKCAVVEEQFTTTRAIGGAKKCYPRKSPSLDVNYNMIAGDSGMSYFPGYAINIETGERLNMAFGEDSYVTSDNGTDMIWNPTSNYTNASGDFVLGGRHVVYVFSPVASTGLPSYDECHVLDSMLQVGSNNSMRNAWSSCMWVGYTMLTAGEELFSNDVRIRIRVGKPYRKYNTNFISSSYLDSTDALNTGTSYYVVSGTATYNAGSYNAGNTFTAVSAATNFTGTALLSETQNAANPIYSFNTYDLAPKTNDVETAKSALDLINVVPNPYFAYSGYEKNQLDNRIKLVNLPSKCTVTIYTTSGTLIRTLKRDVSDDNSREAISPAVNIETAQDWDLKNDAGVPIVGGLYLIHVSAPDIGEKTIKWFGVLRPIDLDTF